MSKPLVTRAGTETSMQIRKRMVHGGEILLDHRFAALAIGLANGFLDGFDGLVRAATRR